MPRVRYTGGATYDIRDGPTFEVGDEAAVGDAIADRLTDRHDFVRVDGDADSGEDDAPDPVTHTPEETIDAGYCPWCEEYEGDAVAQHASAAHPDAWADYTEA